MENASQDTEWSIDTESPPTPAKVIAQLRKDIDGIDETILRLSIYRFNLVTKVADQKRRGGLPVKDDNREQELLQRIGQMARDSGMNEGFLLPIFQEIIHQSRRLQQEYIDNL